MKRILIAVLLCMPVLAHGAFEDVEAGARASAMGGAFFALGDDISALAYNPAGLAGLKRPEALASYERLLYGLSDDSAVSRNLVLAGMPVVIKGTPHGFAGLGWNTLSLSGLYEERKITLGYGYPFRKHLWAGLNINMLSVNYGADDYTRINPVFANGYGKTTFGFDAGVIRTWDNVSAGLAIQDLNEPDLGLKYSNAVGRKISLGVSLRQESVLWNLAFVSANGDLRIKAGTEAALLRKLLKDRVLLRGGLNLGSRDYRNVSLGFGYRDPSDYRVDYSFYYPLSGIADTFGSHRLAFVYNWGKALEEPGEEAASEEPGAAGDGTGDGTPAPAPEDRKPGESIPVEYVPTPEQIQLARELSEQGWERFADGLYGLALNRFKEADALLRTNRELKETIARLAPVVEISSAAAAGDKAGALVKRSIEKYMENVSDSVLVITYASQLNPRDPAIAQLKNLIYRTFPDIAANQKTLPGITVVDQLLQDALDLIRGGRFIQSISTLEKVLEIEPNNVTALTRVGSAYWAMGKKAIARETWRKVLKLDPGNREVLQFLKSE